MFHCQESNDASASMAVSVLIHKTQEYANAVTGSMEHSVNQVNIIIRNILSTSLLYFP